MDEPRTPSYHPRDLEPRRLANDLWWLCVNGDPERIAVGSFGSERQANIYRDGLIAGVESQAAREAEAKASARHDLKMRLIRADYKKYQAAGGARSFGVWLMQYAADYAWCDTAELDVIRKDAESAEAAAANPSPTMQTLRELSEAYHVR
jgi:hypothetical protein